MRRSLAFGGGAYGAIAVLIALLGGLAQGIASTQLLLFILYAAFAALLHELIVGLAAMHSGWFPAFAVALVTLVIGILIGTYSSIAIAAPMLVAYQEWRTKRSGAPVQVATLPAARTKEKVRAR